MRGATAALGTGPRAAAPLVGPVGTSTETDPGALVVPIVVLAWDGSTLPEAAAMVALLSAAEPDGLEAGTVMAIVGDVVGAPVATVVPGGDVTTFVRVLG